MRNLKNLPGWLFLASLVYAPWAYGCTRPWTISVLEGLLAAVVIGWMPACALERRWPRVSPICFLAVLTLLGQGWFMVWNAHSFYDPELFEFAPVPAPFPSLPGAVDRAAALETMLRVSALLGAVLFSIDLFQEKLWRRRFAWTVLATGASLVAYGLIQRMLGAPMIFWEPKTDNVHFFATYYYHGNAGAFINLVLPLISLWTLRLFREDGRQGAKAICLPAVLLTVAGAFVNVSKAAMAITGGLIVVLAAIGLVDYWRMNASHRWGRVGFGTMLVMSALVVLIFAGGWQTAWKRWEKLPAILQDNPRAIAANIGRKMRVDAGDWGFGPGTFAMTFPHYTGEQGKKISGIWRNLHEDYLQTTIEWGRFGAAAWAVLIFGGALSALVHGWKKRAPLSESHPLYLAAGLGIAATALHATVDFPFQIASLQLYLLTFAALGWSIRPTWPAGPNRAEQEKPLYSSRGK